MYELQKQRAEKVSELDWTVEDESQVAEEFEEESQIDGTFPIH